MILKERRVFMPRVSEAQIEQARNVDLLDYLQTHEPFSVKKSGVNEYCLVEHDSFKMSNKMWFWHSRGFGGRSCLDFLIKVRGIDFVTAVQSLTGGVSFPHYKEKALPKMNSPPKNKKSKPFKLPKANKNNDRAIVYLRGRGIGMDVINRCIQAGNLYESTVHRCVFVGKDGDTPRFACERGIEDNWKKDVYGSDKKYSFHLPPKTSSSKSLAVFESAVDVLSHHEIHEIGQTGWDGHRISLSGVSSAALISFLERHHGINNVMLCLDGDSTGKEATNRIIRELMSDKRFTYIKITVAPPPCGHNDYSDTLQAIQKLNKDKVKSSRQQADFSI